LQLNLENVNIIEEIENVVKEFNEKLDRIGNKKIGNCNSRGRISKVIDKEENRVKINLTIPSRPIIIKVDKLRIYQVMINLLNNAIRASSYNSEKKGYESFVTISVELRSYCENDMQENLLSENESSKQFVFVNITDSGEGIQKGLYSNIFSKFVSFNEKGIGLGLYISKGIVNMHGGSIWVYNNYEQGKGATFVFTIPYDSMVEHNK
jgi:signal transduction histidine kinase